MKELEGLRIRQRSVDSWLQSADRNRDPTALAGPGHSNAIAIHGSMGARRFHRPYSIGENSPVIIGVRVKDSARHEAGVMRGRSLWFRIGGIPGGPGTALAARVHHQVGIPCAAPQQPVHRKGAPAAIADVLHHARQQSGTV